MSMPFYDAVGGAPTFRRLVDRFYEGVAADPTLRAMYPEDDLGPAADRLRMFLEQYWGGPRTYSGERGHPRLRMRHAPFAVTPAARDAWLTHMRAAVDDLGLHEDLAAQLWMYFEMAAATMINTPDDNSDAPSPAASFLAPPMTISLRPPAQTD